MSAETDRRQEQKDINPERRLEDVKRAAQEALERFDRELADMTRVLRQVNASQSRSAG